MKKFLALQCRGLNTRMISQLRKGNAKVVWKIDWLGRKTYDLIKLMVEWKEMGVDFWSISEGIGTSAKMGRLWYMLVLSLRKIKEILVEWTLAGMEAARQEAEYAVAQEG
ncbi:recombinase family protein [Dyadobacter endophyticus]|uniref:recombinase family protein n=1 Tax=Dyadobacter endophyticus TaxID=1749036 RepID=UPI003CF81A7A